MTSARREVAGRRFDETQRPGFFVVHPQQFLAYHPDAPCRRGGQPTRDHRVIHPRYLRSFRTSPHQQLAGFANGLSGAV